MAPSRLALTGDLLARKLFLEDKADAKAAAEAKTKAAAQSVSVASYPVLPPIKPLSGPFSPPEWSVAPLAVKYLEVSREGKTVNRIALDKRTHIVGTHVSCDTVCEHASLSRCVDMPLYSR